MKILILIPIRANLLDPLQYETPSITPDYTDRTNQHVKFAKLKPFWIRLGSRIVDLTPLMSTLSDSKANILHETTCIVRAHISYWSFRLELGNLSGLRKNIRFIYFAILKWIRKFRRSVVFGVSSRSSYRKVKYLIESI